jgi:drug/metabolite transporter (DMT)-like permease
LRRSSTSSVRSQDGRRRGGQALRAWVGGALLLLPALVAAGRQPIDLDGAVVAALAVLGFVGTGLAYGINHMIIARDGATAASTVTYLLPAVAVALGVAILNEPATAAMLIGTCIVLIGVTLARRSTAQPPNRPAIHHSELEG